MEERKEGLSHRITLDARKEGTVSGVKDVRSFDEKLVLLVTDCGLLTVKGEGLHVSLLDLEKGEMELAGKVDSVQYSAKGTSAAKGGSLLKRLFQ